MATQSERIKDACEEFGFQYQSIEITRLAEFSGEGAYNRVEDLAKRMYEAKGYHVDRSEGAPLFLLGRTVKAFSDPASAALEASILGLDPRGPTTSISDEGAFAEVFGRATAGDALRRLFDFWCATPSRALWPRHAGTLVTWDFVSHLVNEHTDAVRRLLFARLMNYPGMGWPDLTLLRERAIHFVEVKLGKDSLTDRQKDWALKIAQPLSLRPTLLHVLETNSK